jgi:hypothetical protein
MSRSKWVQVVGCLALVGAGWISGDRVQAETIQVDRPVVAQNDAAKLDGSRLLVNPIALASLEAKTLSVIKPPQVNASTHQSKQQRIIDDIKDSPLAYSRLLPDVGAFR